MAFCGDGGLVAKPFDASLKHLSHLHPQDWLALANLPAGPVEIIDADLSTVTAATDKVMRVNSPTPYLALFEFQSSYYIDLDERTLLYKVLLRWRHRLPVRAVAFLLRPEADRDVAGGVLDSSAPDVHLDFRYRVVRVWEKPFEALLNGGPGTLPLAPLSNTGQQPAELIWQRVQQRLEQAFAPEELPDARTATMILMGLRYPREILHSLFQGVRDMKESVIYQDILQEGEVKGMEKGIAKGRAEGRAEGRTEGRTEGQVEAVLKLGTKRFGTPAPEVESAVRQMDVAHVDALLDNVMESASWEELLSKST
jgi:predicted transposase YdaD